MCIFSAGEKVFPFSKTGFSSSVLHSSAYTFHLPINFVATRCWASRRLASPRTLIEHTQTINLNDFLLCIIKCLRVNLSKSEKRLFFIVVINSIRWHNFSRSRCFFSAQFPSARLLLLLKLDLSILLPRIYGDSAYSLSPIMLLPLLLSSIMHNI